MLVGVHIPRFAFTVTAAASGAQLAGAPAALAPLEGAGGRIGEVNVPAAAAGVRAGMRTSEAFALCPRLALHPADPVAVRQAAERLLSALEATGARVEPVADGLVLLDGAPLARLHGGLAGVLREAAGAVEREGLGATPRLGSAPGRFVTGLAARRARPGRPLVIRPEEVGRFLSDLPVAALDTDVDPEVVERLEGLGIRRIGQLGALGHVTVRDRFGREGERAFLLATGRDSARLAPRTPPLTLRETLALPEPAATEQTLVHALRLLVHRLLGRPERGGRAPRSLLLGARLAGGGSWERHVPLREATAAPERLLLALRPKLAELRGPVDQLAVELGALGPADRQTVLVRPAGEEREARLAEAVRQVQAAIGERAALRVVEVDPQSRLPERRFALSPERPR